MSERRTISRAAMVARHQARSLYRWRLLAAMSAALAVMCGVAVLVGSVELSPAEVWRTLIGTGSSQAERIVWFIRLPRVVAALLAGAGLAVAGAAMQSLLRNPLGSPFTLGLSQAAAFGAAVAIVLFGAGTTQSSAADAVVLGSAWLVSAWAFLLALCAALALVLLARLRGSTPETMILAGVALASLFAAGLTGLQYVASDVEIASIVFWTFGDVGRVGWRELAPMGAVVGCAVVYFLLRAWSMNALDGGDEIARSLGVNASRLRLEGMLIASLTTASVVALVGIIGFVGLIVPHMVRRAIGGDERFLLPASAIGGALLLVVADLAARNLLAPITVPVGVVTSFLGAPLFFYLVVRGRSYW